MAMACGLQRLSRGKTTDLQLNRARASDLQQKYCTPCYNVQVLLNC